MAIPASTLARLLALQATLIFAAPAAVAMADQGEPFTDPAVARYLQIAAAHWGGPAPTCTNPDGSIVAADVVLFDDPDPAVAARAEVPGCRIWLDRDFWPAPVDQVHCTLIVHEWGHLLGYGHSPDPHNVMAATPIEGAPGCAFLAPQPGKAAAKKIAPSRPSHTRAGKVTLKDHFKWSAGAKQRRSAHQRQAAGRQAAKQRAANRRHRAQVRHAAKAHVSRATTSRARRG